MVSVRVFVCVILVVWGLDYVRADYQWKKIVRSKPIRFDYKKGDELNVKIIVMNEPPEAKNYALIYESVAGQVRSIPPDKAIDFTNTLIGESFTLYIQLLEGQETRSYKQIMYGKIADGDNSSAEEDEERFVAKCLHKKHNPCRITVDFGKKGEEVDRAQKPAEINCHRNDSRYTCEPTYTNLPPDTEHQWYQQDENGTFIGIIPKVRGKRTMFKFEIQKFDEKSIMLYRKYQKKGQSNFIYKNFENNSPNNYTITSTTHFSENKEFIFTCSNLAHTQRGWIDPTGYRITTYDNTGIPWNFNKADSGSMLCCLHYNIAYLGRHSEIVVVERTVRNITVLIYKEAVNHDTGEATTTPEQSSTTSAIPSPTTPRTTSVETPPASSDEPTTNTSTLEPAPTQTSTESPHNLTTPEPDGSNEDPQETHQLKDLPQSSDNTKYYIAMVSTAGAILFVSLIYVIVKKCTRKAQDPDETLQLETYASKNMVYAELDIRPGKVPAPPTTEDTTYAEIIGVLRPRNE